MKNEELEQETKVSDCPNGCGDFEQCRGHINNNSGSNYYKVTVTYCSKCGYIDGADARN